jgi:hypothetical protein
MTVSAGLPVLIFASTPETKHKPEVACAVVGGREPVRPAMPSAEAPMSDRRLAPLALSDEERLELKTLVVRRETLQALVAGSVILVSLRNAACYRNRARIVVLSMPCASW